MDNKTKVKVAVVIGIVVLAVIFIFMVIFVKGNRTPVNKNIPTKSSEKSYSNTDKTTVVDSESEDNEVSAVEILTLENVVSLGIKDGNLVKINNDLTFTVVKKLENGYEGYCYGDSKVYTVSHNEDNSYSIFEIDLLKSNYPEKKLFTIIEYGSINNISYYAGKLYFVSGKGQLVEYSISEEFFRNLTNENEVSNFVIDKDNNRMYVSYKPNAENAGIYVLDFTANSFTQIIVLSELAGDLILKGSSLIIDVKEFERLYLYNAETTSIVEIGTDNNLREAKDHVTFYDNVLLYTNGTTIDIKDSSGNSYQDGWYTLNDSSISDISMLDSNKLQIARFDETGKVTRSIVIDLSSGITTEMPETVYSEIVTLK